MNLCLRKILWHLSYAREGIQKASYLNKKQRQEDLEENSELNDAIYKLIKWDCVKPHEFGACHGFVCPCGCTDGKEPCKRGLEE